METLTRLRRLLVYNWTKLHYKVRFSLIEKVVAWVRVTRAPRETIYISWGTTAVIVGGVSDGGWGATAVAVINTAAVRSISETPEEMPAAAVTKESSRTIMLTPGEGGKPRLYGKELSKKVETFIFSGFKSYESGMILEGSERGHPCLGTNRPGTWCQQTWNTGIVCNLTDVAPYQKGSSRKNLNWWLISHPIKKGSSRKNLN